jgi:hypothetical protein
LVVANGDLVIDPCLDVDERRPVTKRHEAAPVVVARQVEDDRAKVGRGTSRILDSVRAAGESDERLLHEVLCGIAVVDEQSRQPHE